MAIMMTKIQTTKMIAFLIKSLLKKFRCKYQVLPVYLLFAPIYSKGEKGTCFFLVLKKNIKNFDYFLAL
jgi:hypothetical protein